MKFGIQALSMEPGSTWISSSTSWAGGAASDA
jgi:hypothetical protein